MNRREPSTSRGETVVQSGPDDAVSARAALAATGMLSAEKLAVARITRLAGLTNRVYAVEAGSTRVALRIPGPGTAAIIDRIAEERNARAAAAAGVAPDVLYFGPDGVMLTPLIDALPLSPELIRTRAGATERAAAALRALHDSGAAFAREFRTFDILDGYLQVVEANSGGSRPELAALVAEAAPIRAVLAAHPAPLRPCHCDPTGGNLLDTGERVWLIDWEYSGLHDRAWDLAYLSLQADFDEALDRRLLTAYFGRPPVQAERSRVAVQKAACELLSILWAAVQASAGNPAADFRAYLDASAARFRSRIASPEFAVHLAGMAAG